MALFLMILIIVALPWYLCYKSEKKKKEEMERIDNQRREREKQLEKIRKEQAEREEAERKAREEHDKALAEKKSAYNTMVSAITSAPVVIATEKAKKSAISFLNSLSYTTLTARSNIEKLSNYVVIDTETTGLKCTSDEIIEVAAIRFRGFEPVEKFVTLLAPNKPIPEHITAINHITNDMVFGKPCFQQIAASLVEFIGSDNIVGHNLPFDLKFIVHYGANVTETKRKYYDTLAIAQKTIKKVKMKWDREFQEYVEDFESDGVSDHKLDTLCAYLGIPQQETHRAESDALATGLLFQCLIDMRVDKNR